MWGVIRHAGVISVQGCGGIGCTTQPMEGMFQWDEGGAHITPITFPAGDADLNSLLFPPAATSALT